MVTRTARIGALVAMLLFLAVVGPFLVQSRLMAQQDDRWLAPELPRPADANNSQAPCESRGADAAAVANECQSVRQRDAFAKAKPPGPVRPRAGSLPRRPAKSKTPSGGGGGGTVALITFFGLLGVWCIRGWNMMGSATRHP